MEIQYKCEASVYKSFHEYFPIKKKNVKTADQFYISNRGVSYVVRAISKLFQFQCSHDLEL